SFLPLPFSPTTPPTPTLHTLSLHDALPISGTSGGAGTVHHIAHRLAYVGDVFGREAERRKVRRCFRLDQPRLHVAAGGKASAHHRELQRAGEIVALPDRRVDRVVRLPCSPVLALLPRRIGNGAEELA